MKRIFVDRSRYETAQRCARARYLEYHWGGTGISSSRRALPLAVGSAVHVGLAELLRGGGEWTRVNEVGVLEDRHPDSFASVGDEIEEGAVAAALADFSAYANALDAPDAERNALYSGTNPPGENVRNEFDEYLFREQSALVEGLVRAYARRRLRPLLEEFEVLEVEREGEWLLSAWDGPNMYDEERELWFMSRPDALLRERASNLLHILSYKTTGSWDMRKEKDAQHDMQGMSEGIEIERRLAGWWQEVQGTEPISPREGRTQAMVTYLCGLDAPPRIHAIRMEYMLKGERWKDRDLSERFGVEMRSQKSHLIRRYEAVSTPQRGVAGYAIGDSCWSWDYIREDGRDGSLVWQNWKSRPMWDAPGGIRGWIDKLDSAAEQMSGEDSTMGMAPRLLGYHCDAQAVGVTREHPLDAVFIAPLHVYRNDDDLRDMVDQMEASERRIAEGVAVVAGCGDADDTRHALNVHFPQTRRACSYPTQCQFVPVCYGGEDIRKDPVASGLYRVRTPNHPIEGEGKNE